MDKTIGIIGGGQLALMLIQAAAKFGINCICLDPNPKAIAFKYCHEYINSEFENVEALKELESKSDVILYEFENVNLKALQTINNGKLFNGLEVLKYSQNRLLEKELAIQNGFKTTNYTRVIDKLTLNNAINHIGYGGILKTTTLGYDGKGQIVINNEEDLIKAQAMAINAECIYEQKVDFDYEFSMIAVYSKKEEPLLFPPFVNEHIKGILHKTILKHSLVEEKILNKAKNLIINFMKTNNFYGILCIEFFVKDQQLYFNEMAPRPHNSGHITLDATNISQFEQYVRAAMNFKMIEPKLITEMSMINILGQNYSQAIDILQSQTIKVYIYGKEEVVNNRKMGHINLEHGELLNKIDREFKNVK